MSESRKLCHLGNNIVVAMYLPSILDWACEHLGRGTYGLSLDRIS